MRSSEIERVGGWSNKDEYDHHDDHDGDREYMEKRQEPGGRVSIRKELY